MLNQAALIICKISVFYSFKWQFGDQKKKVLLQLGVYLEDSRSPWGEGNGNPL